MQKIVDVRFCSFEFDFGYHPNDEKTYNNKGNIDAKVFVDIETENGIKTNKISLDLKDVSFADFMQESDIQNIVKPTDSLAEYIQILRKVIMLKVASELNMEVADVDYTPGQTLREKTEELEQALLEMTNIAAMQEQRLQESEQAIIELSMLLNERGNE